MTQAEQQQQWAEILEPLIEENLNMWDDWNEADPQVVADNVAIALVGLGTLLPQAGRPTTDVPTGEML